MCPGDYTIHWGGGAVLTVRKQYIGNFTLKSGGLVGCLQQSSKRHCDAGAEDVLSRPVMQGQKMCSAGPEHGHCIAAAACAGAGCLTGVKLCVPPIAQGIWRDACQVVALAHNTCTHTHGGTMTEECVLPLAKPDASLSTGRLHACDDAAGLQAAVRDHSWYNESLYDDIMAEFQPLTSKDVLVISYGGWYERFQWDSAQVLSHCARSHTYGHELWWTTDKTKRDLVNLHIPLTLYICVCHQKLRQQARQPVTRCLEPCTGAQRVSFHHQYWPTVLRHCTDAHRHHSVL